MAFDLSLKGTRVAVLATDMVEEAELTEPWQALEDAGAIVELIAPKEGRIIMANHFNKSEEYPVDITLDVAQPTDFDALLLPGGAMNADMLRVEPKAQRFVQQFDEAGKPIAAICHAPWLLVSAEVVDGRRLTSFHTIVDDIQNAGGDWLDKEVVVDNNWVTSRKPDDIPVFIKAMLELFAHVKNHAPTPV